MGKGKSREKYQEKIPRHTYARGPDVNKELNTIDRFSAKEGIVIRQEIPASVETGAEYSD